MLDLSLRPSRIQVAGGVATAAEIKDKEIADLEDLRVGMVVRGYVKAVTDIGVFVRYRLHLRGNHVE